MEHYAPRESGLLIPFRAHYGDSDYQGTLGEESTSLLAAMQRGGFRVLHDLPNNPPDDYDCPYTSVSAFAIDSQRIDLEQLAADGDLRASSLTHYQHIVSSHSAGPEIRRLKDHVLDEAYGGFMLHATPERKAAYETWREREADWLEPYAAFETLRALPQNQGARWQDWEVGSAYSPDLVAKLKADFPQKFATISYVQWTAEVQTMRYLDTAKQHGIEVWSDVPFYVGEGEVWANRDIFDLDTQGNQRSQGGAAPSQTSWTGQVWGNATYRFNPEADPDTAQKTVDWWVRRLQRSHAISGGKVRLDHFIGLAEPYIMAADATDGLNGWRDQGVGDQVLERLVQLYGSDLPFYPEDLGTMTEKTPQLRDRFGLDANALAVRAITKNVVPGDYREAPSNPSNYRTKTVGISSNHDSPPLIHAFDSIRTQHPDQMRKYIEYLNEQSTDRRLDDQTSSAELAQVEINRLMRSAGRYAILGVWDVLGMGVEGQYNYPGTIRPDNWTLSLSSDHMRQLARDAPSWRKLNEETGRLL